MVLREAYDKGIPILKDYFYFLTVEPSQDKTIDQSKYLWREEWKKWGHLLRIEETMKSKRDREHPAKKKQASGSLQRGERP